MTTKSTKKRASLAQELAELETSQATKRQELRALDLAGAFYVLHSPGRGYYDADKNFHVDPNAGAVTKFDNPRAALESLQVNPISGDPTIKRVMNGTLDETFHADYIVPQHARTSDWRNYWHFYDSEGEL